MEKIGCYGHRGLFGVLSMLYLCCNDGRKSCHGSVVGFNGFLMVDLELTWGCVSWKIDGVMVDFEKGWTTEMSL